MRCFGMTGVVLCMGLLLSCMSFSPAHALSVGDHVYFGHYEQDGNRANGPEKIEWIVLGKRNGCSLLISKYGLDCKPFHKENVPVTWEKSDLRTWLNSYFYKAAFTKKERDRILEAAVPADKDLQFTTDPGNDTVDKVFLLSITESIKFFAGDKARECRATPYARAQGAEIGDEAGNSNSWWWLRSPSKNEAKASFVTYGGDIFFLGHDVHCAHLAVRPALWLRLPTSSSHRKSSRR